MYAFLLSKFGKVILVETNLQRFLKVTWFYNDDVFSIIPISLSFIYVCYQSSRKKLVNIALPEGETDQSINVLQWRCHQEPSHQPELNWCPWIFMLSKFGDLSCWYKVIALSQSHVISTLQIGFILTCVSFLPYCINLGSTALAERR